jgi:hypothetical protein
MMGLLIVVFRISARGGVRVVMPYLHRSKKIAPLWTEFQFKEKTKARFSFPQLRRRRTLIVVPHFSFGLRAEEDIEESICGAKRDQLSKIGFARSLKNRTLYCIQPFHP